MTFTELIQIDEHGDGLCAPIQTVIWLCESGKSGRFLHFVEHRAKQWELLCALEDALIDSGKNEGWTFVVGRINDDMETEGWLESEGWVIMPYGPKRAERGSDMGIWKVEDFPDCEVWAETPCAPESGMILNKYLKENFYISESLGS